MAQRLDPDGDISTGSWVATPLWSKLDDGASANDGDEITSSAPDDVFEISLSNPAVTPGAGTTTVTVRAKVLVQGGDESFEIILYEGVTIRGSTIVVPTTSYADYTFNGSSITDFNNLSITVTLAGEVVSTTYISWIKVDVPDGGTTYEATLTLTAADVVSLDVGNVMEATLALTAIDIASSGNLSDMVDTVSLANVGLLDNSVENVMELTINLSANKSISVDAGNEINVSLSLSKDGTLQGSVENVIEVSTILTADKQFNSSVENVLELSISIASDGQLSSSHDVTIEVATELSLVNTITNDVSITLDESTSLTLVNGINVINVADLVDSVTLQSIATQEYGGGNEWDVELILSSALIITTAQTTAGGICITKIEFRIVDKYFEFPVSDKYLKFDNSDVYKEFKI